MFWRNFKSDAPNQKWAMMFTEFNVSGNRNFTYLQSSIYLMVKLSVLTYLKRPVFAKSSENCVS